MKVKGFSLIEAIVAVAIFAIILIPIGIAFNQSIRVTSKSKENMDIAQVLNKAMEKCMLIWEMMIVILRM